MIDDDEAALEVGDERFQLIDLAGAKQQTGLRVLERHHEGIGDNEVDGFRKAACFG